MSLRVQSDVSILYVRCTFGAHETLLGHAPLILYDYTAWDCQAALQDNMIPNHNIHLRLTQYTFLFPL